MGFGTPRIRTKRVRDPLDTLRQRFGTQRHPTGRVWDTTDTLQVGFGTPPRPTRPGFRARSPAGGLRRLPPALCSAPLGCVAVKTLQIPPETLHLSRQRPKLHVPPPPPFSFFHVPEAAPWEPRRNGALPRPAASPERAAGGRGPTPGP